MTTRVNVGGSPMEILIAAPAAAGPHPALIVAHHRGGVDEFTRGFVAAMADAGFVAACPHFYHRRPKEEHDGKARDSMTDVDLVADLGATIDVLVARSDVRRDSIGIVGHCMGGRIAFLGVTAHPPLRAAVMLYGGNIMQAWGPGPSPFARAGAIRCAVAGFFGNDDTNPSPADRQMLDAELTRLGVRHVFHAYDGAGHAFQDWTRASVYRKDAAKDAQERLVAFLGAELGLRRAA
ncbi:MAG: hypothetical protein FJX67_11330 [Alphaproteobacteria bacterium]|nr:hypothetical protein [Alphaproteobacteria bacterium]